MRVALLGSAAPARLVMRDLAEHTQAEVVSAGAADGYAEALSGADVALGLFESEVKAENIAATSAITAKVPYISSGQTAEAFQALGELDDQARTAGAMIVSGLGWAPGITNLMAKHAAGQLETPQSVRIAWAGSCMGPLGQSLLTRAIKAFSGDAVVFEDETWRLEGAGKAAEQVFFPQPVGWRPVALCAAAEPLSIPQTIEGVKRVWVKGGMSEPWAHRQALKSADPWARPSHGSGLVGIARLGPWLQERLAGSAPPWSAARVDVQGMSRGESKTVAYGIVDQLPNLASAPLVAGAILVGRMASKPAGVSAPEQVFDPLEFFDLLAERGVRLARLEAPRPFVK